MSLDHLLYEQEQRENGYTDMDVLRLMHEQLQAHYDRTRHAAITIQRRWRGYSDRQYIAQLHVQATTIQRVFRGFLARRRVERMRAERRSQVDAAFYASAATQIQRVYRGHHSRTHYADYYRRRLYLQHVTHAGQQVARDMRAYHQQRSHHLRTQQQQQLATTLAHITRHSHHLLSTHTQPSVWRSRWGDQYDTRVGGRRLEELVAEEWKVREKELRRLRLAVKRAERQQQAGKRIQEMFIAADEDEEGDESGERQGEEEEEEEEEDEVEMDELEEERGRAEAEEKQQISLNDQRLDEIDSAEANDTEADMSETREKDAEMLEETVVMKSRFPPIHRKPTFESEHTTEDDERERQSLNRSIIWSREDRPITVERPKERLMR